MTNTGGAVGYSRGELAGKQAVLDRAPPLAENIDNRIAYHLQEIERLKQVKETLSSGSILDVRIEDLRQAMNY
jgi:hypothetical protein